MKMNLHVAALLAGTMFVPAAYAQDTSQDNQSETSAETDVDADIVVQPDAPAIAVDVPEPDVSVDQARPDVTVDQGQPEIIVRQPAPQITVDIPQPEIIVRMPDPDVSVDLAAPDVSVSQGEATVAVGDADAAAVARTDDDENADVNVQRSNQANVTMQDANQRPNIRYESEEANVEVNQEQGEPNITYENADGSPADMGDEQSSNQTEDRMSTAAAQTDMDAESRDSAEMAVNSGSAREVELSVLEITEYDIVGENGNTLGDIESVVNVQDQLYAVVESGGFLGLGEKTVAIPLSSLVVRGNQFVSPNISESQVESLQEFDASQYEPLDNALAITVGSE